MSPIQYLVLNDESVMRINDDVGKILAEDYFSTLWFAVYHRSGEFMMRINSQYVAVIGYTDDYTNAA